MTRNSRTFGLGLAALAVAAAGAMACGAGGGGSESKDSTTFAPTLEAEKPAATTKPPAATGKPVAAAPTIDDGTWVVGEDIPAGTYKVNQPVGDTCYWAITKSGSNGASIIQNDLVQGGRPKVTIKKGQDFETARCGTWTKVG